MSNENNYQDLIGREIYFFAGSFEPIKGIITDVSEFNPPILDIKCEYDGDIAIIDINQYELQDIQDNWEYLRIHIKDRCVTKEKVSFNKGLILLEAKSKLANLKEFLERLQNHITKLENE